VRWIVLPFEVPEKLLGDMDRAVEQAESAALMNQYLTNEEGLTEVVGTIADAAVVAQRVQRGLVNLLLSVLANGVKADHKLDAA
jgi:hypothetical protein